ncbi:hypothetical protein GCM10010269_29070 [Streptomyces humidus]|uniref:Uncharacterized protein n=1 Tax=Streptomyces humidus TaxID=52259 RepID=A0A918L349_9ACTN|nr:hypothetical protein GCM10010269_29070 [Streptomyces humidus]
MQVSKARPVYVFWAGQTVAAIDVWAAMPAPARTAAPATPHVMYLRFLDCRCSAIPHPIVRLCARRRQRVRLFLARSACGALRRAGLLVFCARSTTIRCRLDVLDRKTDRTLPRGVPVTGKHRSREAARFAHVTVKKQRSDMVRAPVGPWPTLGPW